MKRAARRDWGESLTLIAALGLFWLTRDRYTIGGPRLTLALGVVVAIACCVSIGVTWLRSPGSGRVMLAAAGVLAVATIASAAKVVYLVVYQSHNIDAVRLLLTALAIWTGNVIVFAVIYHHACADDFVFLRRASDDDAPPNFLDYLFLSFTTSTAFSPTDTPPLTTRARMLVMGESAVSLATIAISAARAVNVLS